MPPRLLILGLALAIPAAAQPSKFPLKSIQVRGNHFYTKDQVAAATGLKIGEPAGKADFDAARDRLLATGAFETIAFQFGPAPGGTDYAATFDVVEVHTVYPVSIENLTVPSNEISAFLKSKEPLFAEKLPGTKQVLDRYSREIENFLASRNHPQRVLGEVIAVGPDQFKIVFRADEPLPAVSQVTFTGNKAISGPALQKAINDVAFGAPFTDDHFRALLDNQIRPLYDARGMIRVKFPSFTTEPDPKVKGIIVHVTVDEGPTYTLRNVALTGCDPGLLKGAKIKTGDTVNFDLINQGLEKIRGELKRDGYVQAQGSIDRRVDDKAKTVDVTLKMERGPQYTMGKLTINGLDLNSEPVVRKMWSIAEGKPLNPAYPDYFLKQIRDGGFFDGLGTTKATTDIDEKTHVVDVTLTFGSSPKPSTRKRPNPNDEPIQPTSTGPPW